MQPPPLTARRNQDAPEMKSYMLNVTWKLVDARRCWGEKLRVIGDE